MASQKKYKLLSKQFIVVISILFLLIGCFFRFTNLEQKIFWVDEVSTAVRVSGYTVPEVENDLAGKEIVRKNDLFAYQNIDSGKSFADSWEALKKSPEHAPLYFLLTRLWLQIWGSSVIAIRSLPVFLSLLIFPSLYWLCNELFDDYRVSWLAVMFMAVSPFYVAYAQEARPYSLWTATILFMGASLLRGVRVNNWQAWLLYSFSLILGFYTSLLSLYISFFFGVYLLFCAKKNKLELIKNCFFSSILALLAFAPWILVIVQNINLLSDNTSWMRDTLNLADITAVFIGTILLIFGDLPISDAADPIQTAIALIGVILIFAIVSFIFFKWRYLRSERKPRLFKAGYCSQNSRLLKKPIKQGLFLFIITFCLIIFSRHIYFDLVTVIGALIALCILSLSSYSLYYLIANINRNVWLFILCLMASVPLPLVVSDIINGGQSSATPRYLIPLQLGIQIAVAYTLSSNFNKRKFWGFTAVMFLILGIFSCIRNLNLSPIYQKSRNVNNPAIAYIINKNNLPLVIAEPKQSMDVLSLAYSLSDDTKFKVIKLDSDVTKYLNTFENVFILKPSLQLKNKLQQDSRVEFIKVYQPRLYSEDAIALELWKIKKALNK